MDRSEFDRLVNQYPVARSSQFRRGWAGAAAAADGSNGSASSAAAASPVPAAIPVARSPPAASAVSAAAKSSPPPPASSTSAAAASASASAAASGAPSGDFFASLTAHLRASYSDDLTRAIVQRFRTVHSAALGSLSLDDMETVAASMARPMDCARQQQAHSQTQQQLSSPAPVEHCQADLMVD